MGGCLTIIRDAIRDCFSSSPSTQQHSKHHSETDIERQSTIHPNYHTFSEPNKTVTSTSPPATFSYFPEQQHASIFGHQHTRRENGRRILEERRPVSTSHVRVIQPSRSYEKQEARFSDESDEIESFNDNLIEVQNNNTIWFFGDNLIAFLIGPGSVNLSNITRATGLPLEKNALQFYSTGVRIQLQNLSSTNQGYEVREMFVYLLRGKHYRHQASLFTENSIEYAKEASRCYNNADYDGAGVNKDNKERSQELAKDCLEKAKMSYFSFYNKGRSSNVIDLHELRAYIYHRKKINKQERNRYPKDDICKENGSYWVSEKEFGEAVEMLSQRMELVANSVLWLEIIVGAGHHSKNRRQVIRPAVQEYLKKRGYSFDVINKGSLLVTFDSYTGTQPCFGNYYCVSCDRSWKSRYSWVRDFQLCYKCQTECWPFRHAEINDSDNVLYKKQSSEDAQNMPHTEVCGRCQRLGKDCRNL